MSNSKDMSFLDHLEELRWHIIRSTIAVLIVAVLAFLAKDIIFDQIIFGPKRGNFISYELFCSISQSFGGNAFCFDELPFRVQSRTVSGQFSAHLWTSILAGFIISLPLISLISIALSYNEHRNYEKTLMFAKSILLVDNPSRKLNLSSPEKMSNLASLHASRGIESPMRRTHRIRMMILHSDCLF